MRYRLAELNAAVVSVQGQPEYERHAAVIENCGGLAAAYEEKKRLDFEIVPLILHKGQLASQRAYLKLLEMNPPPGCLMLFLDYGGITDSKKKKINIWCATVKCSGREEEHFDFFFDAANQQSTNPGAKKSGSSGAFFLRELLDPARSPDNDGISILKKVYPHASHLRLTGDTGNGFRGYLMLDFLSTVKNKFDFLIELIPLTPRHAYNPTDARIARLNTFFEKLLTKTVIFGAEQAATALHAASNPRFTTKRKFLERTHAFFRVVPQVPDSKSSIAYLESNFLVRGKTGVMGLLYFNFSFETADGPIYPEGYCRARQYGDPSRADNPTFVYTWRKELANTICQKCSDRMCAPVPRSRFKCTKRKCLGCVEKRPHVNPLPLSLPEPALGVDSNKDDESSSEENKRDEHENDCDDDDNIDELSSSSEEAEEEEREDVYEIEDILDHKVVCNKDCSDPQDQYQVSWVGVELATDWTSAATIMTWVRPDRQESNRKMLEEYKATSDGTRKHNRKLAKKAKKQTRKQKKHKKNIRAGAAAGAAAGAGAGVAGAAAGAAAGVENKRRSTRLAASTAKPDT